MRDTLRKYTYANFGNKMSKYDFYHHCHKNESYIYLEKNELPQFRFINFIDKAILCYFMKLRI